MKLNEQECLRLINEKGETAYGLLLDHAPELERKFKRIDKAIRDLLKETQKTFPDAQYYTASGGFILMLGNSHSEGIASNPQQELIALSGYARIGDGDF